MNYVLRNGFPFSKNGLPNGSLYFCDGRLAFAFDKQGVKELRYFMPFKKSPNPLLFRRNIFDSFRCFAEKDGKRYTPEFFNVTIYPFGFISDWKIENEVFRLGVYAVNESLCFTLEGDVSYEFGVSFYEQTQLMTHADADFDTFDYGLKRTWQTWETANSELRGGVEEKADGEEFTLKIAVSGNNVSRIEKAAVNTRYTLYTKGEKRFIFITFGSGDVFDEKVAVMKENFYRILSAQLDRYTAVAANIPKLRCADRGMQNFFALAPLYHESLKPIDANGCVRAHTARYWVWGWDTIISNESSLLFGNLKYVKDMLDYFETTADCEKGLVHGISFDNTPGSATEVAAQGMYISLLALYFDYTRDEETVKKHYPFALKLFGMVLKNQSKIKGMIESSSLFPDFVKFLKETGKDISLFNNSVAYPAARAMETLAILIGDEETAAKARAFFTETEKKFTATFWNKDKEYFITSADSETLEQRDCAIPCGYFWDGGYHEEFIGDYLERCKNFVLKNAIAKSGFRSMPLDYEYYDGDANQLHCCWIAVEEFVVRILKNNNCKKELEQWINRIGYWSDRLTCPEGISSQFETETPEFDRWNCTPGIWQAYSLRKWYGEILGIYCGVEFDHGGISFAVPIRNYKLDNITFLGRKIRVESIGEGDEIEYIQVNKNRIYGSKKLPFDLLRDDVENKIIVNRCGYQFKGLARAYGVKIENYRKDCDKIRFTACALGTKEMRFENAYDLFVDGKKIALQDGKLKLQFEKDKKYLIEFKVKYGDEVTEREINALSAVKPIIETYKSKGETELKAHIFMPQNKPTSGIMCIHGGGWHADDAERYYRHCAYFAENGLLAVSVDYGLLGKENKDVRDLTKDCADALTYLRKKFPGVRFIVLGESAGGYMATSLGNREILKKISPDCAIADGVVDLDGIVDLKGKWRYGIEENAAVKDAAKICKEFSPTDHVSAADAPIYILHGNADSIVSIGDSRKYARKCARAGVKAEIDELEGIEHAFILFDYAYDNAFVLETLKTLTNKILKFFRL